jgi:hypothetical protein
VVNRCRALVALESKNVSVRSVGGEECKNVQSTRLTYLPNRHIFLFRLTRQSPRSFTRSGCVEKGFADYFVSVFWFCIFEKPLHCEYIDALASSTGSRYERLLGVIYGC